MMSDEENVEVVPLTSKLSFASSTFSTPPRSGSNKTRSASVSVSSIMEDSSSLEGVRLAKQLAAALLLALTGWYYPRYLMATEDGIAHKIVPFQKTAAGDVILDFLLNEPLVDPPTVPENMLVYTSVHLPLLWVVIMAWMGLGSQSTGTTNIRRQRWHDVHGAVCGLLTAIGLSEGATVLLKLYIQRRRPNFYALCGWSNELLRCTAPLVKLREANFSFPSGHSSLTSCAMTFLAWFLLSKVVAARGPRWLALSSCVLPGAWAAFVGASRLVDHWHHPSDVVAGLLLGGICSTAAFHTWYPPVWLSVSSSSSGQYVVGLPWSLQTTEVAKLPSFSD